MARASSRTMVRDIAIIAVGVAAVWFGLQAAFGTQNPFYVVASGSMVPALEVYDVIIVQGHDPIEEVEAGDIIVFDRPSDHSKVIVHRVVSITGEDPRELRTKGDANPASIPGTDFPITEDDYIGRVVYTVPQIGYVSQLIKPPVNYIIIVIVIGIMIARHVTKGRAAGPAGIPDPGMDAGPGAAGSGEGGGSRDIGDPGKAGSRDIGDPGKAGSREDDPGSRGAGGPGGS